MALSSAAAYQPCAPAFTGTGLTVERPVGIAAADLDLDGDDDLAVWSAAQTETLVLLNSGEGDFGRLFAPNNMLPVSNKTAPEIADFNGDGFPDIVRASPSPNTITVSLNNGDGTFAQAFGQGSNPTFDVSAADLDADGDADVAAITRERTISVLFNDGDAMFPNESTIDVAGRPVQLLVTDLDDDGDNDIVYTDKEFDRLALLANDGAGGFMPTATLPTAFEPSEVGFADVAGDANRDLVVSFDAAAALRIFPGNGDGTFGDPQTITGDAVRGDLQIADFDNDGDMDFGFIRDTGPTRNGFATVVLNNGDGTFTIGTPARIGGDASGSAIGDFNGDGSVDIVTANQSIDLLSLILNDGDGSFPVNDSVEIGEVPTAVAIEDLNGDLRPDIITANDFSDDFSVVINAGGALFDPEFRLTPLQGTVSSLSVADLDGDGDKDVASNLRTVASPIGLLINDGAASFSITQLPNDQLSKADLIHTEDLDGDGDPDLALTNYELGLLGLRLNNGDATFGAEATFDAGQRPNDAAFADLDGDGDIDAAFATAMTQSVTVIFNQGDATFGVPNAVFVGAEPESIDLADLDGDGVDDMVVTSTTADSVVVLRGVGDGTFEPPASYFVGGDPTNVSIADADGDGDLDLASASEHRLDVTILLNDGEGRFANDQIRVVVGPVPAGVFLTDLDNDTDQDIVVKSFDSTDGVLTIAVNSCAPSVCPADTDGDAIVALDDLLTVLAGFGSDTPDGASGGDVAPINNPDGSVTLDDLLLVLSRFGDACGGEGSSAAWR
jgi:hypothetical protein